MRLIKLSPLVLLFFAACAPKPPVAVAPVAETSTEEQSAVEAESRVPEIPTTGSAKKVLVGYALDWVAPVEQLDLLTHLVLFSIQVSDEGEIVDTTLAMDYKKAIALARSRGVAPLVSIGGWGRSGGFSVVVADPALRAKFVENIASFLDERGFEGVDLDWEYPTPEEMPAYADLALEIKAKIGADRWLTSAIGLGHKPTEFDPRFFDAVDLVMLMSYDWGWAPENQPVPEPHAPDSLLNFLTSWSNHAPKSKLVFGIPFYARSNANWGEWKSWAELVNGENPADELNETGGYNYNGPQSVRHKVKQTLEGCYRGVMVWQLGHDLAADHNRSMLKIMREQWNGSDCVE